MKIAIAATIGLVIGTAIVLLIAWLIYSGTDID